MNTVGIIGGLGPETTANFYLEVVFSCYEITKEARPPMLIWNVPLPYKVEEEFITKSTGEDQYLPYLIDAAKRLEQGGADFIVIPCNSVHIFIDEVRKSVSIPVLSIIDETVNFLKEKQISETGILATSATIGKKLYEGKLLQNDIKISIPNKSDQETMGNIINNLVHSRQNENDKEELLKIIDTFTKQGIKTLLLACTDLQLLVPSHPNMGVYDTMAILVDATVKKILA